MPFIERRRHDGGLAAGLRAYARRPLPAASLRSLGLGLITGAADDDPSAIGTYAAAGAKFGPALLWTAPITLPMIFVVVYLCSKLGQVCGEGLFAVLRQDYPKWMLHVLLAGVLIGNVIEAGADLGGMAAALMPLVPLHIAWIEAGLTALLLVLQLRGSYPVMRDIFRWLALVLLAYVIAALLAHPQLAAVVRGTLVPHLEMNADGLAMMVAILGTTLSAYLYSWQSNVDVEEDIAMGRRRLTDRMGTTKAELHRSTRDIWVGMLFSNTVMYFIILSTAATLFRAGQHQVSTAAQAAQALRPLAGPLAAALFAAGVVGVGFLAVPVMTIGAAYDMSQAFGWRHGLHARWAEAKPFYRAIALLTLAALAINFFGINPMKALVWAGIVQGFSTPFLLLLVLRMTNDRKRMGPWVNTRAVNVLGWATMLAVFAALGALAFLWCR